MISSHKLGQGAGTRVIILQVLLNWGSKVKPPLIQSSNLIEVWGGGRRTETWFTVLRVILNNPELFWYDSIFFYLFMLSSWTVRNWHLLLLVFKVNNFVQDRPEISIVYNTFIKNGQCLFDLFPLAIMIIFHFPFDNHDGSFGFFLCYCVMYLFRSDINIYDI